MKNLIGKSINQYQVLLKIRETDTRILFKVFDTKSKRNLALDIIKIENIDCKNLYSLLSEQIIKNAKLVHSNIATVIDSGIFEDNMYFVYNFSPFQPLRRVFNQKFSWKDSARGLVAITQAMAFAHEKGVVHGFLSPTNIILDESKNPYLFDFGFEEIIRKYILSHLPGSWINNSDFSYCSPEQLIGDAIDARSDVYAMGLILYEWLTGEIAFLEETALATLYKRKMLSRKALDLKKIEIPEIKDMIQKCIAANPGDRYQSMQELSVLLARAALDIKITPKMVKNPLAPLAVASPRRWYISLILLIILTASFAIFWNVVIIAKPVSNQPIVISSNTPFASAIRQEVTATFTPAAIIPKPTVELVINQTQAPNKIDYPVLEGTSLPLSLSKISPENSVRLITLSRWGIGELNCLTLSPDGSLFAAASPYGVFIYKSNGFTLQKYLDTSSWVRVVEFSPDGKKLAIGDRDGLITVMDTVSWNEIKTYSGHKAGILDLAFSPDGSELASIAADDKLIKWSNSSDPISITVNGITSLTYSSGGSEIITGGNDFKVNVWNATNLRLVKAIATSSKVVDLKVVNKTSILVVGGADRGVILIDLATTEKSRSFIGLQNALSSVAVSPDLSEIIASDIYGGIVAWNKDGNKLWDVPTWVEGFVPSTNIYGINHSLLYKRDSGMVISGLRNGTIRFFKAIDGSEIKQDGLPNNLLNNQAQDLAISHDSNFVLSQNSDGNVKMWDLKSGKFLYQVRGKMFQGEVFSTNDQYFALAVDSSTVNVYNTVSGKEIYNFNGFVNIQAIQFVNNDEFLVAGSDPSARIWSMSSGQEIQTSYNYDDTGCTVFKSLDDTSLFHITKYHYVPRNVGQTSFCKFQKVSWMKVISIDDTNSFIAFGGNSKLGAERGNETPFDMDDVSFIRIEKVAVNSDGTLLAAALDDHSIGIWDLASKKKIMQLFGPNNSITALKFTSDGTFLLSSSLDGTIRVWGIP